jgi:HEAT repeat protein
MRSLQPMLMTLLLVAGGTTLAQAPAEPKRESQRAPDEREALALAAMEGLMQQSPERALPIIKKVLAGSQSTLVKKRALFVLSQIESPESEQILLQTARSPDAALRSEAIRSIGIGGHDKALAALLDVYNAGDADVKSQVLHAWMIAGRKQEIYQAALNAKSEDEAGDAINMLSVMGAVEELRKLGDRPNASGKLVEAYAISGDLQSLRKIVDSGAEPSVRAEAVRKIGIISNSAARSALREIYAKNANEEIKDAALQGMLIAGDEQGVLALYKGAATTDEKRMLLRTLTMMDGDAALEAIDSALEDKK